MEKYDLSFKNAPDIRTELPGPKSLEMLKEQDKYETNTRVYTDIFKLAVKRASGSTIEDMDGNIFIDWFAGYGTLRPGTR